MGRAFLPGSSGYDPPRGYGHPAAIPHGFDHAHGFIDENADLYPHPYWHENDHLNRNFHRDSDVYPHVDFNLYLHFYHHLYSYLHSHTNLHGYGHPYAHSYAFTYGNRFTDHNRQFDRDLHLNRQPDRCRADANRDSIIYRHTTHRHDDFLTHAVLYRDGRHPHTQRDTRLFTNAKFNSYSCCYTYPHRYNHPNCHADLNPCPLGMHSYL